MDKFDGTGLWMLFWWNRPVYAIFIFSRLMLEQKFIVSVGVLIGYSVCILYIGLCNDTAAVYLPLSPSTAVTYPIHLHPQSLCFPVFSHKLSSTQSPCTSLCTADVTKWTGRPSIIFRNTFGVREWFSESRMGGMTTFVRGFCVFCEVRAITHRLTCKNIVATIWRIEVFLVFMFKGW
jgi:hypothetical protein